MYKNNAVDILLASAEKLFQESLWLDSAEKNRSDEKSEYSQKFEEDGRNLDKAVSLSSEHTDGEDPGSCTDSALHHQSDPSLASYYLASNMIIQDNEKQQLLEAENIVMRLR